MVTPALTARSGSGLVNASNSKPWLRTPAFGGPTVQAPVSGSLSVSAPLRLVLQLLSVDDEEVEAVEGVQLEVAEDLWNSARLRSMPRPVKFASASNASLISGLNCRFAPDATMPWQPVCAALVQIAPLPDSAGLPSTTVPGVAGTVVARSALATTPNGRD